MTIHDVPLIFTAEQFALADADHIDEHHMHMTGDIVTEWADIMFGVDMQALGEGCYGQVFLHPTHPDYVIKVSHQMMSSESLGGKVIDRWVDYLHEIKDRTEPWFPRIGQVSTYQNTTVAIMEKLEPFKHSSDIDELEDPSDPDLEEMFDRVINYVVCECYLHNEPADKIVKAFVGHGASMEHIQQNMPMLKSCFELFYGMNKRIRFNEDIHSGNVMLRGNQFVITDPIC